MTTSAQIRNQLIQALTLDLVGPTPDVLAQLALQGLDEEATELREEVLALLLALNAERSVEEVVMGLHSKGAKQVAKAIGAGASGARRGRLPKSAQAGETVACKVEQMGLG